MFEDRDQRIDLIVLVLTVVTIFLGLSLVSYDPADPLFGAVFPVNLLYEPDPLVYPPSETVGNWCGQMGATVADLLLTAIGWGSYFFVGSMAFLIVTLFFRRPMEAPFSRIIGWALCLIGFVTLVSMLSPASWQGPVIGPGGYLGALGEGILHRNFARIGGFILATSVVAAGVLLWTDYLLLQLLTVVSLGAFDRFNARRKRAAEIETPSRRRRERDGLSVRIQGKQVDEDDEGEYADDEFDEYDDYDDEEFDLEDEEEADEPNQGQDDKKSQEFVPAAKKALRGLIGRKSNKSLVEKEPEDERQEVIAQLEEASLTKETSDYDLPTVEMLQESEEFSFDDQKKEVRRKARILEKTFRDFGFKIRVVEVETGPVIAQYEIELEAGLRLSKITSLADDLAIALRAPSVRIVAPIPGKNTVGIEVPNQQRQTVRLRDVMEETDSRLKKMQIPLFLGKDVSGNALSVDLATLPHLLIAGRTGTGKSVCLNAIISSILMTRRPDEVRMLMIDPKMVELSGYKTLPHLMHPVVTDMRKAEALLAWAVDKMEERYQLLAKAGVRHISAYNQLGEEELMKTFEPEDEEERISVPLQLPYIVIVADEMADLMMTSGKEVEQHIIRLAQKSRAVGIHLILATQKPTVDVITGLIKSNLPARICFQVASRTDSRVVLDEMGADKLLGNGDLLFLWPGTSTLLRGQGTFVDDNEIRDIVDYVSTGEQNFVNELVHLKVEDPNAPGDAMSNRNDDLYDGAVEVVIREGRGSVSLLQRNLGIGYGRAARMIDWMAEDGIVGAYAGSQAREVLITMADWQQSKGAADEQDEPPELPGSKASNRIVPDEMPLDDEFEEEDDEDENVSGDYDEDTFDEADEYEGEDFEAEEYEYDEDAIEDGDVEEFDDEPEEFDVEVIEHVDVKPSSRRPHFSTGKKSRR